MARRDDDNEFMHDPERYARREGYDEGKADTERTLMPLVLHLLRLNRDLLAAVRASK